MNTPILDRVRAGCARVAQHAQSVHIDWQRIAPYALSLPLERLQQPEHDAAAHYLGHGDDTAAFFVMLDSINFGSGYFPHLTKRPGMSGYFTVASSLNDYVAAHGIPSAQMLTEWTVDDCARIFGQDPANAPVRELMQLFATALNDLGHFLLDQHEGSTAHLIRAADGSAEQLVSLLSAMPFYRDEERYVGEPVAFYKRAQLLSADLALAFHGAGLGQFNDLHHLTIFADNLVPHVLRMDGVLVYEPALAEHIDAERLVAAGSREEIEIRACALHAVEQIGDVLRASGHAITSMQLDYLLWNRGQEPYYKRTKPRHRARTVFY
jgi:hypothetical protein